MKNVIFTIFIIVGYSVYTRAQLYVQSGATLKTTNGAIVCLQDMDLNNNGILIQLVGDGRFVFNGVSNSFISGGTEAGFDVLEIAKTGPAILTLQHEFSVGSAINFTSGFIELNNNNITLATNALLVGERESSHITGTSGGYIQMTYPLNNAPFSLNPGNLGAVISCTQSLGDTYIRRGHVAQTNTGTGAYGINRFFDITPTNNTSLNAELDIHYFDSELNSLDATTLQVFKSPDGGTTWSDMGKTAGDTTDKFVGITGVNGFSRWTLASINTPLPVTLLSYKTVCGNGTGQIDWVTATEMNTADFDVEKSPDAVSWTTIATVAATDNISGSSYTVTDANLNGVAFYRIRTVDRDGHASYSPVFSGNCSTLSRPFLLYPNPAHTETVAQVAVRQAANATVQVFNSAGQSVYVSAVALAAGNNQVDIPLSGLAAGNYVVKILIAGSQALQASFIKL
jgi:type IX secretion system substrate protein